MTVRTRFSPSPTGMIHLGNARAALFSALYAKKNQGIFILRIEDTDVARSQMHYVDRLQNDLHWLGVNWQEGPGTEGTCGPYFQSQRQAIYARYYQIFNEKKLIYPCFCTDQELVLARKLQLARNQAPRYLGTCLELSPAEIEKRLAQGLKPAWRFRVPSNTSIEFTDLVKGPQRFLSDDMGDFIIRRADSTAPFLFCNAVDDAMMEVSHVLRGEDHLANTPRQIMLLQALDLPIPQYGHLSLIVGEDGAPLSKRHGSFSLHDMRLQGFLPLALLNYLARLGHTCEVQDLLSFDELAEHFYLEKLSRSPARFDKSQLLFWQKGAVQRLAIPALWKWLGDNIQQQVPTSLQSLFAETIKANITFPHDAEEWIRVFFSEELAIDEEGLSQLRDTGQQFFMTAIQAINKYGTQFDRVLVDMKQALGLSGKRLFMPLRIALTGKTHGPELAQIAALLGAEKVKKRLERAQVC